MLTPKSRKSSAAEGIRRLVHICVGSLKIPGKGEHHIFDIVCPAMRERVTTKFRRAHFNSCVIRMCFYTPLFTVLIT